MLSALFARPPRRQSEGRSLEDPRVPINDATLETFGRTPSGTGVQVSHGTALTLAAVWQAVSQISGDVAKLPLSVYRRVGDEGREVDRRHPAQPRVRRMANEEQTAFAFWRQLMADALLWGNAYAWIERSGRGVESLVPLLPDRTVCDQHEGMTFYRTEAGGRQFAIPAENVLHIRGLAVTRDIGRAGDVFSPGAACGADLVAHARECVGLALAAEGFNAKFFKHGARSAGILELPAGMSKPARDQVEEGFRKYHDGPDNWFKTVVLRDGAKFHQVSFSAKDAETHQLREDQVRDVARFFNLSPSRLGLSDSVSYNSKAEDNQNYLDTTLSPWLESIASTCWMRLLSPAEQQADSHYFEHNTAALLRLNAMDRARVYHDAILDGWMSRAEVRKRENLPAGPDDLGEYLRPANTLPSASASTASTDMGQDAARMAHRRWIYGVGANARRKAARPASLVEWVDGGLEWHRAEYERICGGDGAAAVAPLLDELRSILERETADGLAGAVDRLFDHLEART